MTVETPTRDEAPVEALHAWRRRVENRPANLGGDLPMVPVLASRVVALVQDDKATVRALTELIQRDQIIAAKLLRVANTMLYASRSDVTSLNQAVVRLGFREVRNIVVGLTLSSAMSDADVYGEHGPQLQLHSIGAAYAARAVAERVGFAQEEAFLGGLFHDIGKLLLMKLAHDVNRASGFRPSAADMQHLLAERHAMAGADLLHRWHLPAVFEECVRLHHQPGLAHGAPLLTRIVHAADRLCHVHGFGCVPQGEDLAADPIFRELGLSAEWLEAQAERLPAVVDVASEAFR